MKTALVPLHTWLPDAHSQAPSGISAMLSGVVIEAGPDRDAPLARLPGPGQPRTWGALILAFGALNMIVGNLMALRQTQVKRMLAYSSVSHMGYMLRRASAWRSATASPTARRAGSSTCSTTR